MNREQRRQAKRLSRIKPNRSRAIYTTKFTLEHESFDTIDRVFDQIRHGALNYVPGQGWVIMGLSGEDLHIVSAMSGWIQYWQELAEEHGIEYDDSALRRLAKSLEYEKPLNMAEVEAAAAVVEKQRAMYRALPKSATTMTAHRVKADINRTREIAELMGAA